MLLSGNNWIGGCDYEYTRENTRGCKPFPNAENMGVIHTQLNKLIEEVYKLKKVTKTLKNGD